jgi:tetratricopeptide (TPR) repeat protein
VEVGPRLRLQASLYSRRSPAKLVTQVSVDGDGDSLSRLVDDLVRSLVAQGRLGGAGTQLTSVAARTTSSVPALKAFLEGEWQYQQGDHGIAERAYERAVELDSTFALAWYRLAIVGTMPGPPGRDLYWYRRTMLERAARHADRLTQRERDNILAWQAVGRGDLDEAERRWQAVLTLHPDDVEALTWLGTFLFVFNGTRGRSPLETRDYFWRASEIDPKEGTAAGHLFRVMILEGRRNSADSLARAFLARVPDGEDRLVLRAARALHLGGIQEQDSVIAELAKTPARLGSSLVYFAATSENPGAAYRLAKISGQDRFAAYYALALGRWRPELMRSGGGRVTGTLLFCAGPFTNVSRAERESVRRAVERIPVSDEFGVIGYGTGRLADPARPLISRPYRDYLLGLLSARLGDERRALDHARRLDAYRDEGDEEWRDACRDFAASIRATVLSERGRAVEGLSELERAPMRAPLVGMHPVTNRVYERFLRAELLHAVGRDEEALRWYSTLHASGNQGIVYLAPCELRQAQIHERMGHRDEAIRHYRRFVELWKDCDPELRPEVEGARKRLAALVARKS